jgi:hypothetical protein
MSVFSTIGLAAFLSALTACASMRSEDDAEKESLTLQDPVRNRPIPIRLYMPTTDHNCTASTRCPVAIISSGYGIRHTDYSFIASTLNRLGYLVVAVQHELRSDPPLATTGNLFDARTPNWIRGAESVKFVHRFLKQKMPDFRWDHPLLVGHSNGGDISAWVVKESPSFAGALITLDNRRVPLPRGGETRFLSVRSSDFPADAGVLPSKMELSNAGSCVLPMADAHHNDMSDGGPTDLKRSISAVIEAFVDKGLCSMSATE